MKIGIMARTLEDGDGMGVANRIIIDRILELDRETEYVMFYANKNNLGRYNQYSNVKEVLLQMPNKFIWDQVLVPFAARKEKVDVIYHPKFSVPLLSKIPTVVVCGGLEYYTFPEFYEWPDRMYNKLFLPLFYRKAAKVIAISDDLQHMLHRYTKVPYDKMETVYFAANHMYFPRTNKAELEGIKKKYAVPDECILTVTKVYQGKKPSDRKNINNVVKAFLEVRKRHPSLGLVLAGEECHRYISTFFGKHVADDPAFVYTGWVSQQDIPYLYNLARAMVLPSYSESYGLPFVEAMACGCPVITSTHSCCAEIVGDAGIVVDPTDVEGLAGAIDKVVSDPDLRRVLKEKGLQRAKAFSWTRSAEQTIQICKDVCRFTNASEHASEQRHARSIPNGP